MMLYSIFSLRIIRWIGAMYSVKMTGPRTDPCGTPHFRGTWSDVSSSSKCSNFFDGNLVIYTLICVVILLRLHASQLDILLHRSIPLAANAVLLGFSHVSVRKTRSACLSNTCSRTVSVLLQIDREFKSNHDTFNLLSIGCKRILIKF